MGFKKTQQVDMRDCGVAAYYGLCLWLILFLASLGGEKRLQMNDRPGSWSRVAEEPSEQIAIDLEGVTYPLIVHDQGWASSSIIT